MDRTHRTADVAITIGAPSERWLIEQIRSGRFPARKVGRHWVMTDQDILDALDICANGHSRLAGAEPLVGLTPRSQKRVASGHRRDGGG